MSEYWIKAIGCVESADSINGDIGHAGQVRDHYRTALIRYLRDDGGDGCDGDFDEGAVDAWLHEQEVECDDEDAYMDPINTFLDHHRLKGQLPSWASDYGHFEFAVFCALRSNSDVRCVEHAIKVLGWIRVLGNSVQCRDYAQLHQITEGLWEIDPEGNEDDTYYIEVMSTGEYHECALKNIDSLQPRPQEVSDAR